MVAVLLGIVAEAVIRLSCSRTLHTLCGCCGASRRNGGVPSAETVRNSPVRLPASTGLIYGRNGLFTLASDI